MMERGSARTPPLPLRGPPPPLSQGRMRQDRAAARRLWGRQRTPRPWLTPSPTLPARGRVSDRGWGSFAPRSLCGTSPLAGEDGRGFFADPRTYPPRFHPSYSSPITCSGRGRRDERCEGRGQPEAGISCPRGAGQKPNPRIRGRPVPVRKTRRPGRRCVSFLFLRRLGVPGPRRRLDGRGNTRAGTIRVAAEGETRPNVSGRTLRAANA